MNCCYAIINSSTNVVENVVMAHNASNIPTESGQSAVLGNSFVKIGMTYDQETGTFPEVGDKVEKKNLCDKIIKEQNDHLEHLNDHGSMPEDERSSHMIYISQLADISEKLTYAEMKTAWDARSPAPEITPEED